MVLRNGSRTELVAYFEDYWTSSFLSSTSLWQYISRLPGPWVRLTKFVHLLDCSIEAIPSLHVIMLLLWQYHRVVEVCRFHLKVSSSTLWLYNWNSSCLQWPQDSCMLIMLNLYLSLLCNHHDIGWWTFSFVGRFLTDPKLRQKLFQFILTIISVSMVAQEYTGW